MADDLPKGVKDLHGQKFGRLTVVGFGGFRVRESGVRRYRWNCVCECGRQLVVESTNLVSGNTRSCGCYNKEINSKTPGYAFYTAMKWGAVKRKLECEISFDTFREIAQRSCAYCGAEPLPKQYSPGRGTGVFFTGHGLDRIDNSKGYVRNNVCSCCWTCNRAKGPLVEYEWESWLDRVCAFRTGLEKSKWPTNQITVNPDTKEVLEVAAEEMLSAMELDPDEKAEFELWDNTLMDGLEDEEVAAE